MDIFTSIELTLNKDVKKGDQESLLTLFNFEERVKRMDVQKELEEGEQVKVVLEGLGETDLVLGNDMEKGQRKTIMTLFWFPEKSKKFEMTRDAKIGEKITIKMWN